MIEHIKNYVYSLVSPEWQWHLVGVDILVIIGMLFVFKHTIGVYSGINVKDEVSEKDNPAYGIVLGCLFFSFFLIMSAASTGDILVPITHEVALMLSYGVGGILMLLVSKTLFDKVSMKAFCVKEELRKGNVAASIVDGGNIVATAIIVFAYMGWVKTSTVNTLMVVAFGWLLSQGLLSLLTWVRAKMYRSVDGETLIDSIKDGNVAVAVRFTGYRISLALAPLITLPHYPYESDYGYLLALEIFITSILLAAIYVFGTFLTKKVIFRGVDFHKEINQERNYGLAFVELAIVLGLTFLNYGLLR